MPKQMSLSFLGTCAGGGPLVGRACSSSVLNLDGALWLIDCAEGTQLQLQKARARIGRLNRIFVTHMHIDHCMGIVPLLSSLMFGAGGNSSDRLRIEIYGPSGLRELIRTTLRLTQAQFTGRYTVHELLTQTDTPYPCQPKDLHMNEVPGRDIWCDEQGLWRDFERAEGITIHAGPIVHRIPCLGYVFEEPAQAESIDPILHLEPLERNREALLSQRGIAHPMSLIRNLVRDRQPIILPDGYVLMPPPLSIPGRKVVVLGDTSNASGVAELAMDASLLVHEATNAYIPAPSSRFTNGTGKRDGESQESVKAKAISRGHSTPVMAGEFARRIRARRLVMNHFSAKFPPLPSQTRQPSPHRPAKQEDNERSRVLREIEDQATNAWKGAGGIPGNATAITGWDFLSINILGHEVEGDPQAEISDLRAVKP